MQKKGFTLIELLVVIAIMALLSTLAVVALSSARQKSRDAKRLADIKQVQTALELYFIDQNAYPASDNALVLGGANAKCLGAGGFAASDCTAPVYMGNIPANPTPGGEDYAYTVNGTSYSIEFTLEGANGGLALGAHTASPAGIQ